MVPAPAIESIKILPDNILEIRFEGMSVRYVDLKIFPLLGVAKKLLTDLDLLSRFKLVDGVPEWDGKCLICPDELLDHSVGTLPKPKPEEKLDAVSSLKLQKVLKKLVK